MEKKLKEMYSEIHASENFKSRLKSALTDHADEHVETSLSELKKRSREMTEGAANAKRKGIVMLDRQRRLTKYISIAACAMIIVGGGLIFIKSAEKLVNTSDSAGIASAPEVNYDLAENAAAENAAADAAVQDMPLSDEEDALSEYTYSANEEARKEYSDEAPMENAKPEADAAVTTALTEKQTANSVPTDNSAEEENYEQDSEAIEEAIEEDVIEEALVTEALTTAPESEAPAPAVTTVDTANIADISERTALRGRAEAAILLDGEGKEIARIEGERAAVLLDSIITAPATEMPALGNFTHRVVFSLGDETLPLLVDPEGAVIARSREELLCLPVDVMSFFE